MTNPLMQYLPPQPKAPVQPQGGAMKFHGVVAESYDAKREPTDKWKVEQRIIEGWLSDLPAGTKILDAPVGTGRFLKCLVDRGLPFIGLDIQPDMLVKAALKVAPLSQVEAWVAACNKANQILPLRIAGKGVLMPGNVLSTGAPDKSVDVALNIRITRWMIQNHGPEGIQTMLREMQRVARQQIIITARVANHSWAVTEDLIKSALDGWRIHRNEAGYVLDYRIIELRPI